MCKSVMNFSAVGAYKRNGQGAQNSTQLHNGVQMTKMGEEGRRAEEEGEWKQALAAFYFLFCIHKGRLINVIVFGQRQHSKAQHSSLY